MHQRRVRFTVRERLLCFIGTCVVVPISGCAFNFELTSQRTALENQIMGTYKEIDDEVVLVSKVKDQSSNRRQKSDSVAKSDMQQEVDLAKQNQEFNRDDIEDLKKAQILGEANDGTIVVLPQGVGMIAAAKPEQIKLANLVVFEENRDRETGWQRQVVESQGVAEVKLEDVKEEFAKNVQKNATAGHWLQDATGRWVQKVGNGK